MRNLVQFILCLAVLICASHDAEALEPTILHKNVVVLHSYHKGQKWNDDLSKGIADALGDDRVEVFFEYMDSIRTPTPAISELLFDLLRGKYQDHTIDVVMPTDEEALDFILRNRKLLFPSAAIVYCGINHYIDRFWEPALTGIIESVDIAANVELARSLHPALREVFVVMDNTAAGTSLINAFIPVLRAYSSEIDFRFSSFGSFDHLVADIKSLGPDSAVFLVNYTNAKGGEVLSPRESAKLISENSKVPVYSVWDSYMGQGILGGKLISGYDHGRRAGSMALRIIDGEPVAQIPVETSSPSTYLFDYSQLQRFGISETTLPEGSTVLYKPDPLYLRYKRLIWTFLIGAASLSAIIVLLSFILVHRRRVEKSLKQYSDRLNFLHRLDQSILNNFSLESVGEQIFRPTLSRLKCDLIGIHLFEQEAQPTWALTLIKDAIDTPLAQPVLALENLPEDIGERQLAVVLGATERECISSLFTVDRCAVFDSYLLLPLVYKNTLLGIFFIGNGGGREVEIHQKTVGQQIAHTLALAIQNHYLFTEVRKHEAKLRHMSINIIEAQEQERKRISAELHDEFGQSLTAIGINFGVIKKTVDKLQTTALAERMTEVEQSIALLSDQVHNLSLDLRPPMLDDLGIVPTLRWFANLFHRRSGLRVLFSVEGNDRDVVSGQVSVTMYRVLQEALNNVAKHAQASSVEVTLSISDTAVSLTIADDGKGFDMQNFRFMEPGKGGLGLLGMQERVDLLNGYVEIQSRPGTGTIVMAVAPLERGSH